MTDVRDSLMVARNSDGKLIRRPLSPHLQVYRPQVSTVLSITHRATGIALSAGAFLLTWWLVAAATSDSAFAAIQGFLHSIIGLILMFGWTLCLWYHFLAGIRHLAWDAGYGFTIPTYHRTGFAVVIGAIVLTIVSWIVAGIIGI